MRKIERILRGFLYSLPAVLYFSYYPIISLGSNETMNLELSLPILWLVLFDFVMVIVFLKKKLWKNVFKKWAWLLFPIFVSLSVLWSENMLRGILTIGILWLVYFAVFSYYECREFFRDKIFKKNFLRIFFIASLVICGWCFLQCILDVVGVSRNETLMCLGCSYTAFGFPHPNGFAIEPQFMGNLLLAPVLVSMYLIFLDMRGMATIKIFSRRVLYLLFFVFSATLFLTFSRGAIYSMVIGVAILTIYGIFQIKNSKTLLVPLLCILAFLFTLNLQGVFAQISKTNDTYMSGIAKVIEQLSLGIIKIPKKDETQNKKDNVESMKIEVSGIDDKDGIAINEVESAVFDGYVEESTNVRLELSGVAIKAWIGDVKTFMVGTGIGGAGKVLYEKGLIGSPKEIVQNEYASLLLETGVIGFSLFVLTVIMIFKFATRSADALLLIVLITVYGLTLLFFSGLTNVLHIYLLTGVFSGIEIRKKLVS